MGCIMDKWTELRTAYKLAKLGTLSATALEIGVHRSTVMRHIDVLESNLRVKLFQRNDRGYIPTEAGIELMRLGEVTDDHFTQLETRLVNQEHNLSGTLTLTCVNEITRLLMPTINEYQAQHPAMSVDIIGDLRNFNLEYGEADLAIRAGPKPTTLDNIVMPLLDVNFTLCADETSDNWVFANSDSAAIACLACTTGSPKLLPTPIKQVCILRWFLLRRSATFRAV